MKTLTINRPAGLDLAQRHLNFIAKPAGDIRNISRVSLEKIVDGMVKNYDGSWTHDATLAFFDYARRGCQLVVEKALSRDLETSKVSGSLDSLIWPSEALHIVFEDETLPSILVHKRDNIYHSGRPLSSGVCVVIRMKDGSDSGILLGNAEWENYCNGPLSSEVAPSIGEMELSSTEESAIRYMVVLAAKVLAYASIPRHVPVRLTTHEEKKKAGVHPRQQTFATTLLYRHLPRIVRDPVEETEGGSDGSTHRFMGRAGHLRLYSHERYKEMKGQWQWIPPIPPPEGIQVVYKVRKVDEPKH